MGFLGKKFDFISKIKASNWWFRNFIILLIIRFTILRILSALVLFMEFVFFKYFLYKRKECYGFKRIDKFLIPPSEKIISFTIICVNGIIII